MTRELSLEQEKNFQRSNHFLDFYILKGHLRRLCSQMTSPGGARNANKLVTFVRHLAANTCNSFHLKKCSTKLTMDFLVLFPRSSRLLSLLSTQSAASSADQNTFSSSPALAEASLLTNSINTETSNGSRIPVHEFAGAGRGFSREQSIASPAAAAM